MWEERGGVCYAASGTLVVGEEDPHTVPLRLPPSKDSHSDSRHETYSRHHTDAGHNFYKQDITLEMALNIRTRHWTLNEH